MKAAAEKPRRFAKSLPQVKIEIAPEPLYVYGEAERLAWEKVNSVAPVPVAKIRRPPGDAAGGTRRRGSAPRTTGGIITSGIPWSPAGSSPGTGPTL